MSKISNELRSIMLETAAYEIFKLIPTVDKKDLKKVVPGTVVVIKWNDTMPTTELVLEIDDDNGLHCYDLKRRVTHDYATTSQIISVIGKL